MLLEIIIFDTSTRAKEEYCIIGSLDHNRIYSQNILGKNTISKATSYISINKKKGKIEDKKETS